jgi:hypothetical protein
MKVSTVPRVNEQRKDVPSAYGTQPDSGPKTFLALYRNMIFSPRYYIVFRRGGSGRSGENHYKQLISIRVHRGSIVGCGGFPLWGFYVLWFVGVFFVGFYHHVCEDETIKDYLIFYNGAL